ncbi:MAG: glycosyltransferase [Geminicoccaceae bacterium]
MNERLEKAVIVTAADSGYFDLLRGMIHSVRRFQHWRDVAIVVFDVGITAEHRSELERDGIKLIEPEWHFGLSEETAKSYERAALVRFFIHDYLPDYDYSLWLDPDLWLQDSGVLDRMLDGAEKTGAAIAHESDRLYAFQGWLWAWNLKHKIVGSGLINGLTLMARPSYNLGLYCLRSDAPHWTPWRQRFERALARTQRVTPYEQFAFNEVIHIDKIPTVELASGDNWICDRCPPVWDGDAGLFCRPEAPFPPLSVLHLAGPAKNRTYEIEQKGGGVKTMSLRYRNADSGSRCAEAGEPSMVGLTAEPLAS